MLELLKHISEIECQPDDVKTHRQRYFGVPKTRSWDFNFLFCIKLLLFLIQSELELDLLRKQPILKYTPTKIWKTKMIRTKNFPINLSFGTKKLLSYWNLIKTKKIRFCKKQEERLVRKSNDSEHGDTQCCRKIYVFILIDKDLFFLFLTTLETCKTKPACKR